MDVTAPGRELHGRFVELGVLTGMSLEQIIRAVGQPTSFSAMAHGQTLVQWQATGCHMALLFDSDNRFLSLQHQYANYAPAPNPYWAAMGVIAAILIAALIVIANNI